MTYAAREAWNLSPSEGTGRTTYGAILLAGNPASGRVDVAPGPTPSPGVGPNPLRSPQ